MHAASVAHPVWLCPGWPGAGSADQDTYTHWFLSYRRCHPSQQEPACTLAVTQHFRPLPTADSTAIPPCLLHAGHSTVPHALLLTLLVGCVTAGWWLDLFWPATCCHRRLAADAAPAMCTFLQALSPGSGAPECGQVLDRGWSRSWL